MVEERKLRVVIEATGMDDTSNFPMFTVETNNPPKLTEEDLDEEINLLLAVVLVSRIKAILGPDDSEEWLEDFQDFMGIVWDKILGVTVIPNGSLSDFLNPQVRKM